MWYTYNVDIDDEAFCMTRLDPKGEVDVVDFVEEMMQ